MKTRISRITVARLYNLGSYEHARYELTAEVSDRESAAMAMIAIERILSGLRPIKNIKDQQDFVRAQARIDDMKAMNVETFDQRIPRYSYTGTREEYIARLEADLKKEMEDQATIQKRALDARKSLDDLGGAVFRRDFKLDWETDDDDF